MSCGGACEGHCTCVARKGAPRRFQRKAEDAVIVLAVRERMLEDPAGTAVILTEAEYLKLQSELEYWKSEAGSGDGGCGCT